MNKKKSESNMIGLKYNKINNYSQITFTTSLFTLIIITPLMAEGNSI